MQTLPVFRDPVGWVDGNVDELLNTSEALLPDGLDNEDVIVDNE